MKKYNTDDPKLTAYALGELDEAERAAVETQLAEDETSRKFVQEVRESVADLSHALNCESHFGLTESQREEIVEHSRSVRVTSATERHPVWRAENPMFKLTFHTGSLSGNSLDVVTDRVVIGRTKECDICLNDDGVSRRHCALEKREDGIYVCDLGATNAVRINGRRMREMEQRLEAGDELQVGPVRFTFELPEVAAEMVGQASSLSNSTPSDFRPKQLPYPLLFLRSTWGAVLVGIIVALLIALPLLFLLPEPRQTAQNTDDTEQTFRNTFASNADFLRTPTNTTVDRGQPQIPQANSQEPPQLNDPDPPRAEHEPPIEPKDSETPPIRGQARIITGFDSSYPRKVARVGENHFTIDMKGPENNFFLFKLEGAEGKKIRVDLINLPHGYAPSLNPVYSYVKSLDGLDCLAAETLENPRPLRKAKNGPPIPDTSGQKWHYIENVSYGMTGGGGNLLRGNLLGGRRAVLGGGVMSFEETFEQDTVFVSMRFPYTYGYNEAFLTKMAQDYPWVQVHTIGQSQGGRNLRVVQIGEPFDREVNQKPTIIIYAREHGNEQDSSFAAEGAIRFLASDELDAVKARLSHCFLVIPLLDPDGAVSAKYNNVSETYLGGKPSSDSKLFATWFKRSVDDGKRLDLVLNLHNVRSAGFGHLFSPMMEPSSGRLSLCLAFHKLVTAELTDFRVSERPTQTGYSSFRLGGWLQEFYAPLYVAYELNSQSPVRHLTIGELREVGASLVRASSKFFESPQGKALLDGNTKVLTQRNENWRRFGHLVRSKDALAGEEECLEKAEEARANVNKGAPTKPLR